MKKIIYSFVCAALLLGTTACDSFLEENPKDKLTAGSYYQTEAQATANVNRLYWRGVIERYANAGSAYLGPKASLPGMLTGYFINSYEGQEIVCKYSRELTRQNYSSNLAGTVNDMWDPCFEAINIANGAIKHIPEIAMSDASKNKLVGEAKFFRAFNYFYLIKTFGDVPLSTEPYESLENLYLERTSVATIYELIESDLKSAVDALPAVVFSNGHRVTKYAAAMLLSTVYFQQGKYADAAAYSKIVIDSPHQLATNSDLAKNSAFNKLRTTDDLDEAIYAVEFDDNIRKSDWWPTYSFNSGATAIFNKYSIFERVYGPIDRYLNVYTDDDLRIQPNQFFHWEYTNPITGAEWKSDLAGCWYYFDEEAMLNTGNGTKDWNIFRYAEALLVAAESIAQSSGVTAEAAGYLAQIKARADMNGKTVGQYTSELQALSKDAFIQECWTERLREFPLEFKIWDDCVRTGKFPVISETEKGKVSYVNLIGAQNASGATFKDTDLLWPISVDELQRNKSLTQNPGYKTE
ncbi:hypothetical protein M2459_000803 [Parabacteroides sp. PF5-5]|uniref:RagB/SusD family nutrient uptake outer membrane protein n=1 Tax=unclassified Parabacteroides TaxID=2649774 RepID=UPI0024749596|nr:MULTISPECIES: RagB/SusD family nutrient uptake outer membrane protein [unclassified Parabacteroides]MDH6304091.1 hypothetical protein [Parabacteroides sp. PH5-39]MDH6315209.1 hypothetical protein [Parabacteroides sp. PF5-13]MDH6318854.1 hypothetical protein [Parabacteroides sp. PH5-13]MDH6322583.1 hypothetical protein [Parabacteroides sp. PH5-8]MDH6326265.1 hypothetical protein [Parabacteroides sp. PH5-41]